MQIHKSLMSAAICSLVAFAPPAVLAQDEPKEVITSQGAFPLDERGLPEQETIPALFDEMDYQGAVQAYLWAMPQMTVAGQHHSNKFYGAKGPLDFLYMYDDPSVPGMLTPNTIVEYIVNFYDYKKLGPMVMEMPGGQVVGMIMDYQQHWVADTGLIAQAGVNSETILFLGPNQEAPDEALAKGWRVAKVKTNVALHALRILDPEKDVALAKAYRIYPYSQRKNPPVNKVFQAKPNDKTYFIAAPKGMAYWERLNEIIQQEVVLEVDRYFMNSLKAIGIEKGKPFKPTERQQDIMERAAFTGEKMSMAISFVPRYGVSPSMKAKIPGKGSTYLASYRDTDGEWLDGGKTYKYTVTPNPPAAQFWACTVYDVATRGIIRNGEDQQTEISSLVDGLKKNQDGSVDIYFGPKAPAGEESNWIKTNPGENWFAYFRLYAPTEKYFDRSWPLNDIKKVIIN
jgi:hypothetical protein